MKKTFLVLAIFFSYPLLTGFTSTRYKESMVRCRKITKESLRKELLKISREAFQERELNFQSLVEDRWQAHRLDEFIDRQVDLAVKKIAKKSSYFQLVKSRFSSAQSKQMAREVARQSFQSKAFQKKIKTLIKDISARMENDINRRAKLSIHRSIECINQFLSSKYKSKIIKNIFAQQLSSSLADSKELDRDLYKLPSIVTQHTKGLVGVGLILTNQIIRVLLRRILRRIARRFMSRLAVRVLARIGTKVIPFIGWGLLAWDAYDILWKPKGPLPEIAKALKAPKVKKRIQKEIELSLKQTFEKNYPTIVRKISDSIFVEWENFHRKFKHILILADNHPEFRQTLSNIRQTEQLYVIVRLYSILGKKKILELAKTQQLLEVVENPYRNMLLVLLKHRPDVKEALAWYHLAGINLDKVIRYEIYKHKNPYEISDEVLTVLLEAKDKSEASKLLLLTNKELRRLYGISGENRRQLVAKLNTAELRTAIRFLQHSRNGNQNELLELFISSPKDKLTILFGNPKLQAFLASQGASPALFQFFLSPPSLNDIEKASHIPFKAFLVKYGQTAFYVAVILLIFLVPMLLTFFIWLIRSLFIVYRLLYRAAFRSKKKA